MPVNFNFFVSIYFYLSVSFVLNFFPFNKGLTSKTTLSWRFLFALPCLKFFYGYATVHNSIYCISLSYFLHTAHHRVAQVCISWQLCMSVGHTINGSMYKLSACSTHVRASRTTDAVHGSWWLL